jgi:peptidoglycan-associated lipoprotein
MPHARVAARERATRAVRSRVTRDGLSTLNQGASMFVAMSKYALPFSAGMILVVGFTACNPKQLSISATDRVYVPSPKEAMAEAQHPAPETPAPDVTGRSQPEPAMTAPSLALPPEADRAVETAKVVPPDTGGTTSPNVPLEEVRVAEPPMLPSGMPQPPDAGANEPPSSASPPMVAEAVPGSAELASPTRPDVPIALSLEDVFFDYDRFSVRSEAKTVLESNAAALKSNGKLTILIEGHCDERGTSEYNLVLGEKRARAVKQYLGNLGIEPARVQITSLGKEKPFCTEHNPACWQKNRRAHFIIP